MKQRVMKALTHRMPQALRRFARNRRGVSAVEFALVAPVMIGLYFGCVEISDGVSASRKVSLAAAALGNLTSQVSTISSTEMIDILDASSAIIAPYDKNKLKITVSCLSVDKNKAVTVKWTATRNGGVGGTVTVPGALTVDDTPTKTKTYPVYLIYSQVSYAYTPVVGSTITGTLTLSDKMFTSPRDRPPTYGTTSCS